LKCKLCLEEKPLLKKSHIIPEFMYNGFYDKNHRMLKVSMQDMTIFSKPRTGEYDSDILCRECDNVRIGKLESYAKTIIYGGSEGLSESQIPRGENRVDQEGTEVTYFENLDYKKFKLFLLSVLWRASVLRRDIFSLINLGSHEEVMRKMIYSGDPKKVNDYPCMMYTYLNDDLLPEQIIAPPRPGNKGTTQFYKFLISGIFYIYFTSIGGEGIYDASIPINEKGELTIIHMPKGEGRKLIASFSGKH